MCLSCTRNGGVQEWMGRARMWWYKLECGEHKYSVKLLSLTFPTPRFSFLFGKVDSGFNPTTQHKSHYHSGSWTWSFISGLGWPPREIKHDGWHPTSTATKHITGSALLGLSKITIPIGYLTRCPSRSTFVWCTVGNTLAPSRLALYCYWLASYCLLPITLHPTPITRKTLHLQSGNIQDPPSMTTAIFTTLEPMWWSSD